MKLQPPYISLFLPISQYGLIKAKKTLHISIFKVRSENRLFPYMFRDLSTEIERHQNKFK